ncbi:MAG: TIGR03960 family B12-binding radical SAM protein, partial [Syntrophomonas sp.]
DLDQAYFPNQPLVPHLGIIHDRAVLEVMRGCQRGCRFCQAGIVYRPVRERSPGLLKEQARMQLHSTGYDEISLASLSTLDYSSVLSLVKDLVAENQAKGVGVALPSLRVDAFSVDLANEVQKVRKTTLTLAPEAGSQRLRDIINKNVSEEQLYEAVESAFRAGWLSVKLYFMYGLPTETEEDLLAIPNILQKVQVIGNRCSRRPVEIRASLACFVPKAHTPFQWQSQDSIEMLDEKRRLISQKRRKNIKISFHDSRVSFLEGVIARGDRRLAPVIQRAWEKGCKFDGWSEYFSFDRWMDAFAEMDVAPESYTAGRSYWDKLPWDFIDIGVSKEFLYEENERAMMGELSWDCRETGCNECGICPALGVALDIKGEESCV